MDYVSSSKGIIILLIDLEHAPHPVRLLLGPLQVASAI